jgi:RimJ/RimL family protein N-acetyltransferase
MASRVIFRPVRRGDLKRLNDLVNDPDVARFLTVSPPISMKETLEFFKKSDHKDSPWYCIEVDGVVAGSVSWRRMKPKKNAHAGDFGISLAREYWGRGLGKKAVLFVVGKARQMRLQRLALTVNADNKRAIRLYRSCGFKKEGTLRKAFKDNRGYHDVFVMARLFG